MLLDLSPLLTEEGKSLKTKVPLTIDGIDVNGEKHPAAGPGSLELKIVNTGKKVIEIEAEADISFVFQCARCLAPVEYRFFMDFQRTADLKLSGDQLAGYLEEESFIENEKLDPDILVRNEILIRWPIRVLCREDCRGICSKCGANRNIHPCDCVQESGDVRMMAIRDIFSKFKEV